MVKQQKPSHKLHDTLEVLQEFELYGLMLNAKVGGLTWLQFSHLCTCAEKIKEMQ